MNSAFPDDEVTYNPTTQREPWLTLYNFLSRVLKDFLKNKVEITLYI